MIHKWCVFHINVTMGSMGMWHCLGFLVANIGGITILQCGKLTQVLTMDNHGTHVCDVSTIHLCLGLRPLRHLVTGSESSA